MNEAIEKLSINNFVKCTFVLRKLDETRFSGKCIIMYN